MVVKGCLQCWFHKCRLTKGDGCGRAKAQGTSPARCANSTRLYWSQGLHNITQRWDAIAHRNNVWGLTASAPPDISLEAPVRSAIIAATIVTCVKL